MSDVKDFCIFFYYKDWLVSTQGMDADARGWYINLLAHLFDKKELSGDIETLATLAGVKHSEFSRFKYVLEHVLKQKLKQNENGALSSLKAESIFKARNEFKGVKALAGKIGYVIKMAKNEYNASPEQCEMLKSELNFEQIDLKDTFLLKQMLEQKLKQNSSLYYINESINESIILNKNNIIDYESILNFFKKTTYLKLSQEFRDEFDVHLVKRYFAFLSFFEPYSKEFKNKNFISILFFKKEIDKNFTDVKIKKAITKMIGLGIKKDTNISARLIDVLSWAEVGTEKSKVKLDGEKSDYNKA